MIIFLYGSDDFRSREKLDEIKAKFLEKTHSGSSLSVVDFEEHANARSVFDALQAGGLFSEKKLVIVKNIFSAGTADIQHEVLQFLETHEYLLHDTDGVTVFWEKGLPKGKPKLFSYFLKKTKNQNFEPLKGKKLSDWAVKRLQEENLQVRFTSQALSLLTLYAGDDLFFLDNEIRKLANYKNEGVISENDVDLLVKSKLEANIFETIEALSSGQKKKALELFHQQLAQGEDAFYIFSMYVYQFRNLLKIAEFYFEGERNQYTIAKMAKLHPFAAGKGMAQLRNFTPEKLKKIYRSLETMDIAAKTGKTDLAGALDKFIVEM